MNNIRTRFAPSPTGFMHVGNLRSALYAYLIAKSGGGSFLLRIEDTDKSRQAVGAEEIIYKTLKTAKLKYDEGPDTGGPYGPYIQSQRKAIYEQKALELIEIGGAYRCFCEKSNSDSEENFGGYNRRCRDLSENQIKTFLLEERKFVIRQKMPLTGKTVFQDMVFGEISAENSQLEDNILLKSDGMPTYNFANVVDDHMMNITHVVRGCEYLTSTPKYNLLYETFGWKIPEYVHLPLIMGKNPDGSITKLSKRAGSAGFQELIKDGFLPEAIVNYIALLGWHPGKNEEIFTLKELEKEFSIGGIGKSPAIFDYKKLAWMNSEYIKRKPIKELARIIGKYLKNDSLDRVKIAKVLQPRIEKLVEIPEMTEFLYETPYFEKELFFNKKAKTTVNNVNVILENVIKILDKLKDWSHEKLYDALKNIAQSINVKSGSVMWCTRVAVSGKVVTPGGSVEILEILGKEESIKRLKNAKLKFL